MDGPHDFDDDRDTVDVCGKIDGGFFRQGDPKDIGSVELGDSYSGDAHEITENLMRERLGRPNFFESRHPLLYPVWCKRNTMSLEAFRSRIFQEMGGDINAVISAQRVLATWMVCVWLCHGRRPRRCSFTYHPGVLVPIYVSQRCLGPVGHEGPHRFPERIEKILQQQFGLVRYTEMVNRRPEMQVEECC